MMKDDTPTQRHYEIDAVRVVALGLLIIYHIFICYLPFAEKLQFLQYDELLTRYKFLGDLLNIWRIPVLFVISGMAAGFVLRRRGVKELVCDRMMRIVPPLFFGSLFIVPIFPALYAVYEGRSPTYQPSPGHLWFLLNLVSYTVLLLPLILWVKRRPENSLIRALRRALPFGLLVILPLPLMLETALSKPEGFAFFPVRFWYGFACYGIGFLLPCLGEKFWISLRKVCHAALPLALLFYLGRMKYLDWAPLQANHWTTAFESGMWMLAFLGYGSLLLNRPSRAFAYLNKAVFPIYIIHMPVQQLVAVGIFPWGLGPEMTFGLHVLFTFALCGLFYEFAIRRIRWLYPVMGLKASRPATSSPLVEDIQPRGWSKFGTALTLYLLSPLVVLVQVGIVVAMTVGQLLAGTIDEHRPDPRPSNSLWAAAINNDVEKLQAHIEDNQIPLNRPDKRYKLPALNLAALNGSTEAVEALIEAGADVNEKTDDGSTPLSHAAFMGHPDIVKILIENEAELNPVNSYRSTPLDNAHTPWGITIAVSKALGLTVEREQWERGRIEVRELLLEKGGKRKGELR